MEFRISTPSPTTTPRQTTPGMELRLSAMIADLRRQAELERRVVQQQIRQLERRLQEQLAGPLPGRERWADLQGSVSGVLMEVAALGRRVDGLDEKLQLRLVNCEEMVRQKIRQLEQQLCAHQHKALLSSATSEALSKRHTARLCKVLQSLEDHSTRLSVAEAKADSAVDLGQFEARLTDLEGKQARLEGELQILATDTAMQSDAPTPRALVEATACGDVTITEHDSSTGDEYASTLRSLESDVSGLTKRTVMQLDSHAAALANLRIRTEGQEQRLSAVAERLESVITHPLNALRAEMTQLREHDRQASEASLKDVTQRLKIVEEASEEVSNELQEKMRELNSELLACQPRLQEEHPAIRKLADTTAVQAQALRRLEVAVAEPWRTPALPPEFSGVFVRMDSLELRMDTLEQGTGESVLAMKADRADLLRLDATVRELTEPMRRLSQRAAGTEAVTATLERRLDQLQDARSVDEAARRSVEACPGLVATAKVQEIADLTARIVDIEGLLEGTDSVRGGLLGTVGCSSPGGLGRSANSARCGQGRPRDVGTGSWA